MNDRRDIRVHGLGAPAPRATVWAALLLAVAASTVFLALLGLWTLLA